MSSFKEVPTKVSFPELEKEILVRWKTEITFERSIENRKEAPVYRFYDGPPFATGLPHYGHILTSYIKDVVPRYFTMKGFHVPRRWGWDCHGLPVEVEAEKALGIKSRADILAYGIEGFNRQCRETVLTYTREWEEVIDRLGRWVDFEHDYKTMDPDYMESVLWCFKTLHESGLIYEGEKVVPWCPRCQTSLSNFETRLDDATRPRQDPAATLRFRLSGSANESFLAWTTTPWTLPANVALAVGPEITYLAMDNGDERLWLAEDAAERYANDLSGYQVVDRQPGASLVGRAYEPLFPWFSDTENAFQVLAADFVDTSTGTGIVHLAPAFGEDDHVVCQQFGIQGPNPVNDDGTFDERVVTFAGTEVFEANPSILRHLRESGTLLRHDTYEHNYPHCWRCDSPLIYRSVTSWFVKVSAFKEGMIAANQETRWVPAHMRDGRFGKWLEDSRDWAISRNRFWGCPLPVWKCDTCDAVEVFGSRSELAERSGQEVTDLHRPVIDEIAFPCRCSNGTMSRVTDVLDCWFESGAMPYAQLHYPFESEDEFAATFPADFIVEYVAQTRGWFYTLMVLSTALSGKAPFKNVVCHGVILAEDGRKMSKRLKNYPDPMELVDENGSDALRIALLSSPIVRGQDIRFAADSVRDAVRKYALPLWNTLHFFTTYATIDNLEPIGLPKRMSRLDHYMLSEADVLRADLEAAMSEYDFARVYERILDFVGVLSGWYVRLVRQQLWRSGVPDEKRAVFEVLNATLSQLARLLAPFMPFLAEATHSALGGPDSVHLEDWPKARPEWRDDALNSEMRGIRSAVRLARRIRDEHDSRHRHPLPSVAIAGLPAEVVANNTALLREELNVKEVTFLPSAEGLVQTTVKLNFARLGQRLKQNMKVVTTAVKSGDYEITDDGSALIAAGHRLEGDDFSVENTAGAESKGVAAADGIVVVLDLESTPELVAEGQVRDLNRAFQDLRKAAGLHYTDRIEAALSCSKDTWQRIAPHLPWMAEQLLAQEIHPGHLNQPTLVKETQLAGEPLTLEIRKV